MPDTIRRRVHVNKKQDRHSVYPLAHSIDKIIIEITRNNDATILLKKISHIINRAIWQHPLLTQMTSSVLNTKGTRDEALIFIPINLGNEAIRSGVV